MCSLSFLKTLPEFANYFPQLVRLAGPENFSGVLMRTVKRVRSSMLPVGGTLDPFNS